MKKELKIIQVSNNYAKNVYLEIIKIEGVKSE